MATATARSQRLRRAVVHIGTSAGPLSLLLLPKCPLCVIPLLAFFGVTVPATAGLWIIAGVLVSLWLAFLLFAARRNPVILVIACIAAASSLLAITIQSRLLLYAGALTMGAAGFALSRICSLRNDCLRSGACELDSGSRQA